MSELLRDASGDSSRSADLACARFVAAWQAGAAPRIEDFLDGGAGPGRDALLRRLVALDVAHRRRRGERPGADDYRGRFPQLDDSWLARALATPPTDGVASRTAAEVLPTCLAEQLLCCPHCHSPIPLPPVQADAVCCPGCGGSFRVEPAGHGSAVAPARTLGRFELLERVGQGTFGAVWRARDTRLDRVVALKVPHPSLLNSALYRERFRREARAAAQLRHPGIVRLYEVAELEPGPVLVTDFIEGVPLKDLLEGQRLPFREAAALVAEVAEAAHYAHDRGLVHRDIKPANIMVEGPRRGGNGPGRPGAPGGVGRPVLVDFGLAVREEAEVVVTVEGEVIGTPAYMSPEQAAGRGSRVDRRSDVYSLGVVLYQLLCGELPFRGSKAMLLHQVLHEEPRPPRRLNDKIPRDLETVCLKALAKEPGWRYDTAGDLAADLHRFLKGEPVRARPVGRCGRLWRWARRNPALAAVSALAAAALAAVAVVSTLFAVREAGHSRRLGDALSDSENQRRRAERRLAENYLDHALDRCARGEDDLGLLWLARALVATPHGSPDLEGALRTNLAAWRCRLSPVRALLPHEGTVTAAAFAPDGRLAVTGCLDGTIRFWDPATGRPVGEPLTHPGGVSAVAFSADGRRVLAGGEDGVARWWDVATRRPVGDRFRHGAWVTAVACSPDVRTLATVGSDGDARLWDAGTGAWRTLPRRGAVDAVAFSPDGRTVLTGCVDRTAQLWDARTGQPADVRLEGAAPAAAVAFSGDGHTIAAAGADSAAGVARLWDAQTGRLLCTLSHPAGFTAVALSPDGKLVLTGSLDRTAELWEAATGRRLGPAWRHGRPVKAVAFGPDGKTVLTSGQEPTAQLRDVHPAHADGSRLVHPGRVGLALFSPDGGRVVTASRGAGGRTEVRSWDASSQKLLDTLADYGARVWAVALSPDGRTVLTGGAEGEARLVAVTGGQVRLLPHPGEVRAVAFRPDGRVALTGGQDHTARLWETATGRPLAGPLPHGSAVFAAAFRPDGRALVTSDDEGGVYVWDAAAGALLHTLRHKGPVVAVDFDPGGQTFLTASYDGSARLWDAETAAPVGRPMPHGGAVTTAAFSPDGRTVVTGCFDGTARLWDAATGEPRGLTLAHQDVVYVVAFSPDGRTVATASRDRTARLWCVRTGRALGPPLPHEGSVRSVAFRPDGRALLTGSEDGTARLWPVPAAVAGEVPRVRAWVQVLTGMELDPGGAVHLLDAREWQQLRRRLDDLGGAPLP